MWDVEQFAGEYRIPLSELIAALERLTPDAEASQTVNSLLRRLRPEPSPATTRTQREAGTPSLTEIRKGLKARRGASSSERAARALASPPKWLVPALRTALDRDAGQDHIDIVGRIEVARTLWHFTRDAATVIPVIAEGLQPGESRVRYTFAERVAADAAGDLGPAAAPLIPWPAAAAGGAGVLPGGRQGTA